MIKDDELLEKYNEICRKISNNIKPKFDSESVYNEKYLKTKIKPCKGKINTHFYNKRISKTSSQCICLSVKLTLRKKCPYSELFWSVFSRIQTEYGLE